VTVVLAAPGYPAAPTVGGRVDGLDAAGELANVAVLHAGTKRDADGSVLASGGRVLAVTALGTSLSDARESAYSALGRISLPGGQYRTDIARAAADRP
jgi:phosphoribosylamine--glycine ligase